MTDDSVYSEAGDYLGEMAVAEDGARVLIADTGEIIAAVDEQGNALDPADYAMAEFDDEGDGAYYEDDPADELRERIEQLREDLENTPQYVPGQAFEAGRQASGHLAEEQWGSQMMRELENVQNAIGRPLTHAEVHAILQDSADDRDAGLGINLQKHVEAAGLIEFMPGGPDAGSHSHAEGRRAFMRGLVEDGQREERGEVYGDQPERRAEMYDTNANTGDRGHSARVQLAMDSIAGHDVTDRTYDSSETYEEDQ